jgi:hypothetical protein
MRALCGPAGRAIVDMLLWIIIRIDLLLAKPRRLSPPIARACNSVTKPYP